MKRSDLLKLFASAGLSLTTGVAAADIGGLLYDCYNGNISRDIVCATRYLDFNQAGFFGRALATATYRADPEGGSSSPLEIVIHIEINDPSNLYQPFGTFHALVLPRTYSFHRHNADTTKQGLDVEFVREYGTTRLKGSLSTTVTQNFGAEYVEYLDKLDLMLPGVAEKIVIDF